MSTKTLSELDGNEDFTESVMWLLQNTEEIEEEPVIECNADETLRINERWFDIRVQIESQCDMYGFEYIRELRIETLVKKHVRAHSTILGKLYRRIVSTLLSYLFGHKNMLQYTFRLVFVCSVNTRHNTEMAKNYYVYRHNSDRWVGEFISFVQMLKDRYARQVEHEILEDKERFMPLSEIVNGKH